MHSAMWAAKGAGQIQHQRRLGSGLCEPASHKKKEKEAHLLTIRQALALNSRRTRGSR